jgi:tetratricopeptide (TPR) repeat protein
MNKGDEYFSKQEIESALKEYAAAEALVPDNIEMVFWHAVTLVNAKRVDEALPLFRRVFAADRNWATLVPRLPKSKMLPDDEPLIRRILSVAP